jgi:tRNA A37 threonylcarbamoyladenosine dehydratase
MQEQFSRTKLIIGEDGLMKLHAAKVAVFGVGGVGGYTVEALARSGIGQIDVFDHDKICITNLNRQLHSLHSNIGRYKVDVVRERIMDINPNAVVGVFRVFYTPETSREVDLALYDYIIDAIDTVSGKIELCVRADEAKVPIISSMGAGNKINAADFEVADIYDTSVCPLARVMRRELRGRGIEKLKVVYSREVPRLHSEAYGDTERTFPGSVAFVPPVVGLIIAGEAIKDLLATR